METDFSNIRTGFVIGLDTSDRLVLSRVGTEEGNFMELLGLAETAVDLIKLYRDQNIPSLLNTFKTVLAETVGADNLLKRGNGDAES